MTDQKLLKNGRGYFYTYESSDWITLIQLLNTFIGEDFWIKKETFFIPK